MKIRIAFLMTGLLAAPLTAQSGTVPELDRLNATTSELRDMLERYRSDRSALLRRYDAAWSAERRERLHELYGEWRARLRDMDYDRLGVEERIDWVLLDNELDYQLGLLGREAGQLAEMTALLPFASTITRFQESRRRREPVDPRAAADTLAALVRTIDAARAGAGDVKVPRTVAFRAAGAVAELRGTLGRWYRFYEGYHPLFTWWSADPYAQVDAALEAYEQTIRRDLVGIRDGQDPIIGDPIGADGLRADLAHEMIAYSPEELFAIAEREFAWCEAEMRRAARDMGFSDDWRAALEKVKTMFVPPGEQPEMVRDLAYEAIEFVESRGLVTVPALAKEIWRIEMLSPARQRVSPFFLGGEVIQVSYPTHEMEHDEKLMSMRGNNPYFSRATVHHELIPGHHLQGFMNERYNSHRGLFRTPFWVEGWALYWEMLLWDLEFPRTPEERVGMLFWRSHRAARILFSLGFHLGTMTPEEAIDLLVDRVGHERANAEAEVRRSFLGTYSPLYQAAYMLGGLQIRALRAELVDTGRMTDRAFHDAILRGGAMPIEMVRVRLLGESVERGHRASWRFAG